MMHLIRKNKNKSPKPPSNPATEDGLIGIASPTSSTVVATPSSTLVAPLPVENRELINGRFGIQTVVNPTNADMDIWFVHGSTGDRESTWTHKNGTFTPDLMHDRFPTARIITYGYDANVVGIWQNTSGEGLRGHGKALCYAISNTRSNETQRPIFFIVHSLGGLVTEQALLVSLEPNEPRLRRIAPCAAGKIFMGTPHAGSCLAAWGFTLARLLDPFRRANTAILSVLKQRSEVLMGVEEVFQRHLSANGGLKNVKIFCFYETIALDVVGFVVTEESATILPHPNCGIDENHKDMTKFTGLNDAGFISVKGVLDDWVKQGVEKLAQEINTRVDDAAPTVILTFNNNSEITAEVFQQGNHNASRDIIHGGVTNHNVDRDWISRGPHIRGQSWR